MTPSFSGTHNWLVMRVGLLSDTHIPEAADLLPPAVFKALDGVDLLLHCGDIYRLYVLDELERLAPVLAAKGDDDSRQLLLDERVKPKHVLYLDGVTVWLMHDIPYSRLMTPWQRERERPDVVVFGHDHVTILDTHHGVLYVNPGSPTFLNYRQGPGTVAILDIQGGNAEARIVSLAEPDFSRPEPAP